MAITIGGGFRISDANPIDDRFVVSASSDRFLTEQARVFEGLTVYSSESNDYFILGDKANYDNANGWHKVITTGLGSNNLELSDAVALNFTASDLLVSGGGGQLIVSGPTPFDFVDLNGTSFAATGSGVNLFDFSGSAFIVSTSFEDANGLSKYEFHATSSPLPANRPEEGIFFYPTASNISFDVPGKALRDTMSLALATASNGFGGPPIPVFSSNMRAFTREIPQGSGNNVGGAITALSGSYEYSDTPIKVFYRTGSVETEIGTASAAGNRKVFAISSSGTSILGGNLTLGLGSILKTDILASRGTNNGFTDPITIHSPLNARAVNVTSSFTSSHANFTNNVNVSGILSLANIANVSTSLAAAIEGAGDLQTVLTNGNSTTLTISSSNVITISGSGGRIIGRSLEAQDAVTSSAISASGAIIANSFSGSFGGNVSSSNITVTNLTASFITGGGISASNMGIISASFGRITASKITVDNFTVTSDFASIGGLSGQTLIIASDDMSVDANGNVITKNLFVDGSASIEILNVGDTTQPGFQWHLTNGTVNGFAPADQAGVKLVTISGSTVRPHTGLIVDASASYVGLIANQDQSQDKPLLIARQLSGGDKEVVITGSAFKIIGTDGTQTFNSNGANGTLTIGNTSKQISIKGSAINLTGSTNFLNDITVGTLKATTKVTASVIESTGRIDAEGRLSGSKLLLPQDDGNYVRGIFFNSDAAVDGRITDDNTDLLIGYNDTDVILLNDSKVQIDVKTNVNSSLTASSFQVNGDTDLNGTLFVSGPFAPTSININGGDFEVSSDGELTNTKTASFTAGISSSYFRTIPAGAVDSIKISNHQIVADGSQSMGIQFDGSQQALSFFGGKTDAYLSHSVKIYGPDSGRSTFLLMSGSDFILEESDGGECFNFRGDTGDIALGRSGGSGNILTIQSANTKVTSATFTISSSTFNISTGSQTTDPDNNATAILVADIVTGRVYTRNSASYALNALSSSFSSTAASVTNAATASLAQSVNILASSTINSTIAFGNIGEVAPTKVYGEVIKYGTTDGSLAAGSIYMLHTDGKWKKTDADSEISSSGMLGVAVTTDIADGFLVRGICDLVMANTTPTGSTLYLHTVDGRATHSPSSGSGDVIRAIGYTLSGGSGIAYFNPDATYIVAS